jgi:hypothetical protein
MIILFAASGAFRMFFASIIMSTSRPRTRGGSQFGPAHRNLFCIIALLTLYFTIPARASPHINLSYHRSHMLTLLPPSSQSILASSSFTSSPTRQLILLLRADQTAAPCSKPLWSHYVSDFFVFRNSQFYSFSSM